MQNKQNMQHMQNMQNMPYLHADSALQQRVDLSCILGHKFRRASLQLSSSCIIHQKVESPTVVWLAQANKIPENSMFQLSTMEAHLFCIEMALPCICQQESVN
jgi:hypothetical protein